jgi:hypothetical protein
LRIRTVKPEFWQSEGIGSLSREVRTLAIGLLNVADDEGYFRAHPGVIAGQLFPYDADGLDFVAKALLKLAEIDWVELDVQSELGRVAKFTDHQRINRPTPSTLKGKWGVVNASLKAHGVLTESSLPEGKGREGKGKERKGAVAAAPDGEPPDALELGFAPDSPKPPTHLKALEGVLVSSFERIRCAKYKHGGAKDTLALKSLMAVAADEEIAGEWERALALPRGDWLSCSTFAQLGSKWNDLTAPEPKKAWR